MDAFLVCNPENRYYLSGYGEHDLHAVESSGYLLISEKHQFLFTDFRYAESARESAPDFELIIYAEGVINEFPRIVESIGVHEVGVEGHYLTHDMFRAMEERVKETASQVEIFTAGGLVEEMRVVKEPVEIEAIKKSLRITEAALRHVWNRLEPGAVERDTAWEIERFIRESGAEAISFPPITASGPNGALPHAVPSGRKIQKGDLVVLDLGARLNHYCSDMTRTWAAGEPSPELKKIYRVVREAQRAAISEIRAGRDSAEIDEAARRIIRDAGYGEYFGHGLGHGVGLAVHEKPSLRKKNGVLIEENMVFTVEPGIYLPGVGGVRLENMVRVTREGCEVLNEPGLFYDW